MEVPHSYAIVLCFQLIFLWKNYKEKINFYFEEKEYYRKEWGEKKKMIYPESYNKILQNKEIFKRYNGEPLDLIYRITFPYNISNNESVPKCIFYTSEFKTFDQSYLKIDRQIQDYPRYLKENPNLYFTSPSIWSSNGIKQYNVPNNRNVTITHGVDTTIFYKNESQRKYIRDKYNIKESDILMINIGAMTKNKGIMLIFEALNSLVKNGNVNYKLLLKGTSDLYQSKEFIQLYFGELINGGIMNKEEANIFLKNHIIFTDQTLSYEKINDLFNASDIYIAPYLCEGFGLCVLEAIASGLHVIVPKTGSTKEYIDAINDNSGDQLITFVESNVMEQNGMYFNNISVTNLIESILSVNLSFDKEKYNEMKMFINKELSWDKVSDLLYQFFIKIKLN